MKKTFLIAVTALLMSSCVTTSYYQVYKVKSELKENNKNFVYEDEVCKLTYDLWEGNNNFSYTFENKSDKDIYIYLPNCFVLKNGTAYDCFTDRESTYKTFLSVVDNNLTQTKVMVQYTDKQLPVIVIPSGAKKILNTNQNLFDRIIYMCDNDFDFPSEETQEVVYTQETTPLVFINRIAYSFEKEATEYNYIDNKFWISGYFNNLSNNCIIDDFSKDCHTGNKIYEQYNSYASGLHFYNVYKRKK